MYNNYAVMKMKNDYEWLSPQDKIEQKIRELNTLNVELNAVSSLDATMKLNELEKKLKKARKDELQDNIYACEKDIYRVFYEETPDEAEYRNNLRAKIEFSGVSVWAYKTNWLPDADKMRIYDEQYEVLTIQDKIDWKLAEHKAVLPEVTALIRWNKSKKINDIQKEAIKSRLSMLFRLLHRYEDCVVNFSWCPAMEKAHNRKEYDDKISVAFQARREIEPKKKEPKKKR